MAAQEKTWVLTEDEALTFLSFLIAAARTQLDDPASYGSMRILTVFEDLRAVVRERVSKETLALLDSTEEITEKAQVNILDRGYYVQALDELNRLMAAFMVDRSGLEKGS